MTFMTHRVVSPPSFTALRKEYSITPSTRDATNGPTLVRPQARKYAQIIEAPSRGA
jgi:hypothetical protein